MADRPAPPTADDLALLLGPVSRLWTLAAATKAMEGWPVRLDVRIADDMALVLELAKISSTADDNVSAGLRPPDPAAVRRFNDRLEVSPSGQ
jgi:hypothetical protein